MVAPNPVATPEYGVITEAEQLANLANRLLEEGKPIGFDVETGYYGADWKKRSTDHYHKDQFTVGFSLTNSTGWARYVPLHHDNGGNIDSPADAWEAVRELLTKGHIVAHHEKFERAAVDKAAGIKLGAEGNVTDTMLLAYVSGKYASANYRTIVGLKDLVWAIFEHKMMHIHELWPDLPGNKFDYIRFNTLDLAPQVWSYACEDALWVLPLMDWLFPIAKADRPFILALEHRISKMMYDVESEGVLIDWKALESAKAEANIFVPKKELYVKQKLGELAERDLSELNLNSVPQMKKLLFQDIGLVTTRRTKKGADDTIEMDDWQRMSTEAKALTGLAKDFPAIQELLEYREVQNLNRRINKWLKEYNIYDDGRVHANYNQVTVPGGRFAAGDPAIQQLPKEPWHWDAEEDSWDGTFRDFIIASPGTYLLTFDYSQAELRVLAGESQEPALLEAFEQNVDVHAMTAALMLKKDENDIDSKERHIGKTFNFALMYGLGVKSLAEQLGVQMDEAKYLYRRYFDVYQRVSSYFNAMVEKGNSQGYVETIFGRRVPIWELSSPNPAIRAKGERVAVNGPIQGSVADYCKIAMLQSQKKLKHLGWWKNGCTIIMNQHDSLIFEVSNDLHPVQVRQALNDCVLLDPEQFTMLTNHPKIVVDWELGRRWGSADKWKGESHPAFEDGIWRIKTKRERESPARIKFLFDKSPAKDEAEKLQQYLLAHTGDTKVQLGLTEFSAATVDVPFGVSLSYEQEKEAANIIGATKVEYEWK